MERIYVNTDFLLLIKKKGIISKYSSAYLSVRRYPHQFLGLVGTIPTPRYRAAARET